MVQVDVVWAYAFGAAFAAASAREIEEQPRPFQDKCFTRLLVFLSVFFAPSGLYLLWQYPRWETMQVADLLGDIPAWLVVVFSVTNITQGILGYWVGYGLIKKAGRYAAHVNWMVAWILFWFILVCGWDTTGWQRFLYDSTSAGGESWSPGKHMGFGFFTSNVFMSLVAMGFMFTPMLVQGIVAPHVDGWMRRPWLTVDRIMRASWIALVSLGMMFGVCLILAIVAAWIVMGVAAVVGKIWLGYLLGVPIFMIASYVLLFRKNMLMYRLAKPLFEG